VTNYANAVGRYRFASTILAVWLVYQVWKSTDPLILKLLLTLLAFVPVFGPLVVLWTATFPDRIHPALRAHGLVGYGRIHDRWRHVLEEKNPIRRFRRWQELMRRGGRDD
jgi:hypothetical protein